MPNLTDIEWASNDITLPNAGTINKIDPTQAIKDNGEDSGDRPTAQEENWWKHKVYEWIQDLDSRTTAALDVENALNRAYPVGSVYLNATDNTNPGTLLNFTSTWVQISKGRMLVGEGTSIPDSRGETRAFSSGEQGGAYQHVLTGDEMPSHHHYIVNGNTPNAGVNSIDTVPEYTVNFHESSGGYILEGVNVEADSGRTSTEGANQPHNNLQPYLTVYIWQRTA